MTTSYVTRGDADDYFASRHNSALWSGQSTQIKDAVLLKATRIIDNLNYYGLKAAAYTVKQAGGDIRAIRAAAATQEHQFPRGAETTVPEPIVIACCEIAYALLSGVDPDEELRLLATTGESVGPLGVKLTFDRTRYQEWTLAGVPSPTAWQLLVPYIRDLAAIQIRRG